MKNTNKLFGLALAMLLPLLAQAQSVDFRCSFENDYDTAGWVFVNSNTANKWYIDTAVAATGTHSMYISYNNGASNIYNISSASVSYAYQTFFFDSGEYSISYNWECYGESSYDYLRVFLAPVNSTFQPDVLPSGGTSTSGFTTTVPAGWICLSGSGPLNMADSWQFFSSTFSISQADTFHLVFMWCSDPSGGNYPSASVDNVRLTEILCPMPFNTAIDNVTSTSFSLTWSDTSGAYQWFLELDTLGQVQGTGYITTTLDTSYTFTGLTPNTTYYLYLAADCNGDTNLWTRFVVTTACNSITQLPFTEDFESAPSGSTSNTTFINCWGHVNNTTATFGYPYVYNSSAASHNGGLKSLYWYSYSSTGPYKGVILPDIDSTIYPVDTLQVSFWARATSDSYRPIFSIGILTNIYDINTFVPVQNVTVTSGTEWQQFTIDLSSYQGPHGRIAILAPISVSTWYAYTDDIVVDVIPECSSVGGIRIDRTGSGSACLSWTTQGGSANAVTGYEIQYDTLGATGFRFTETVTESPFILSGLDHATDYQVRIRARCNLDTLGGEWDSATFTTNHLPCILPGTTVDTVVVTNGSSTTSNIFVNYSWGNTFCESIYTATELQNAGLSAGRITAITVGYSAAGSYSKEISIFMGNTTMNTISTSSMVSVADLTEVCHAVARPNTSASAGWVTYQFSTPFYWDGSSNILIAFFANQPNGVSQSSSGFYAYSTITSPSRTASAYRYKDSSPFTADNCLSTGNSGTSTYRPSVTLHASECLQYASCGAPLLFLSRNEVDTVVIDWGSGHTETSWDILYMASDDTSWTVIPNVTERQYIFTDLLPQTDYTLRVVPACGGDSIYSQIQFTTPCVPVSILPFTEDFETFTASSAAGSATTPCWARNTNYPSTYYPYSTTSYANSGTHSLYFYNSSSYHSALVLPEFATPIDSLQVSFAAYKTTASYSIMVGVMSDPDDFSTFEPIDTISPAMLSNWEMFEVPFGNYAGNGRRIVLACAGNSSNNMYIDDITVSLIPTCPRPRNVDVHNITTVTADVSWDSCGMEYIVEYGPFGFNHGEGTLIVSSNDSTTLYGLTHSTRYEVYVRSVCTVGDTSDWSFAVAFTTVCDEIDTLPFREEFNAWGIGTSARPACWSLGGYSNYPYVVNLITTDSTYRALNMYTYGGNQVYAMLPPLDSLQVPIQNTQVVFTAVGNNYTSYSHTLVVGTCMQPGNLATFSPVDTIRLTSNVTTYEVAFDTVSTGAKYITFVSITERNLNYNYAYLIDVQVEAIPPCQTPNRLRATNVTATSADLQWHDRSGSVLWQVEYGPRGFALGTGTRAVVNANPYSITGLTPSSYYEFYVRSICDVGDTSNWQRSALRFSTLQQPAQVPYFYDFETPDEWNNWQTNSNAVSNWYRDTAAGSGSMDGSGRYSIYMSADSGATVSSDLTAVVNAVAYRDFDFGNDPFHSYVISFRAKAGGTPTTSSGSAYDGLMLLHVDPYAEVEASSVNINSPWGFPDTVEHYFFIRSNGYWNTYSTVLDTLTGVHRFALYWFNQDRSGFIGTPAAVDDFRITSYDCPHPANVRATNVSVSTADIVWTAPPDNVTYRVIVRGQSGTVFNLDTTVYTNTVHLTGLNSSSRYNVYVRRVCSSTDSSTLSSPCSFMTLICNNGINRTLASSNSATSTYLPLATTSAYSYSQQLVLASEMQGSGEISALNLRYTGSAAMNDRTACTVYMGHTTMSSFSNDFVNPDSLAIVYTGTIRSEDGWGRLIFQTPFAYNGNDNLVIAIDDNSGRTTGNTSQNFATDQLSSPMSVCFYSSTNIEATQAYLSAYTGSHQTYNSRNQMMLEVCPPNSCPTPALRMPLVRSDRVTIRWQNTADRYAISYRPASTSSWTADQVIVTGNSYDINRPRVNTDYVYRVRQYCDSTGVSNWAYGTFNSSDIPCLPPEDLHTTNLTNKKVSLAWTPAENNISYRLHIFNTAFDREVTTYIARAVVNGLEAGVTYYAAVQAECDGFENPGDFSDTIQFTTPICPDATHFTVTDVYGNSAVLDWTPGGEEIAWEILYGHEGFRMEEGVTVTADHHPFTLTELFGSTDYEAYIRTLCQSDFPGEHWIGPVRFTTLYSSINSVTDDSRVRLMPNPTRGDVTVTVPESSTGVRVEVLDVTGRICMSVVFPDGVEGSSHRLATSKLAAGTYFLRITASDINTVKKLVVR